jgi:hypothetical protein
MTKFIIYVNKFVGVLYMLIRSFQLLKNYTAAKQ